MKALNNQITFNINPNMYKKDPNSSVLGQKILSEGINMMEEIGFEEFTFKKLSGRIDSTEASIYRYFDNKINFLAYLTSWYWYWVEYRIVFRTTNIDDPKERLLRCIDVLTEKVEEDSTFLQINEVKLHHIVLAESPKIYLNKAVDKNNSHGFFTPYKQIVARVSDIIHEINPSFEFPHMLVTTVIEGAHHQRYFAEHLPRLTDILETEDAVVKFYRQSVLQILQS